jgi:hypothetical protein
MANNCPANCQSIVLTGNPKDKCELSTRQKTLDRVAFFPCSMSLPDPWSDAAIKQLFDDQTIVASSKLGNINWQDPTTEDVVVSECMPAITIITGRELQAEDRVAISFASGSPAVPDDYRDYDFWQDKMEKQNLMNYMLIFCDGDVVIPKDANGNPLTATMLAYISYQKPQTQGGQWIEYKRISIKFQNDPLAFYTAKPQFNLKDANIIL